MLLYHTIYKDTNKFILFWKNLRLLLTHLALVPNQLGGCGQIMIPELILCGTGTEHFQ